MHVEIEKLVFGGKGIARTDEGVVFVSGVLPEEEVRIGFDGTLNGCKHAHPLEIETPSHNRRVPPCAYAGECGGCDWAHIDPAVQPLLKKEIFIDCLKRIGRISEIPFIEVITSPEKHYRIRAQFKRDASGQLGFFRRNSNDIVHISSCDQLATPLNQLLQENELFETLPPDCKNVKLIAGDEARVASAPVVRGYTYKDTFISVANRQFRVGGNTFFQSNGFLLAALGNWAKPYVGGEFCLDLYGGIGFFSTLLADRFKRGILVEIDKEHVRLANENLSNNGSNHFRAIAVSSESSMDKPFIPQKVDCAIVDPPRPGLTRKVREGIANMQPETVLYVSCNPSTQARDIGFFVNRQGYRIERAVFFDCYPNTHHMETALLLSR